VKAVDRALWLAFHHVGALPQHLALAGLLVVDDDGGAGLEIVGQGTDGFGNPRIGGLRAGALNG
jgi:hypothetical protein